MILPLKYTELETGPRRTDRRYFIEGALWQPGFRTTTGGRMELTPTGWRLEWHLFEVVHGELLHVAGDDAATTAEGSEPPESNIDIDLRKFVRLDVNDDGDVEWAVTTDPKRSGRLETEADREADRADRVRKQARDAARASGAKRAATLPRDANRAPVLSYVDADVDGCGLILIAGWSAGRMEAIVLQTDHVPLPGRFDLASSGAAVRVDVHIYNQPVGDRFCSDAWGKSADEEERTWRAVNGIVTIELGPPASAHRKQRPAKVPISDAVFASPSGETIRAARPIVLAAMVGGPFSF